MTYVPSGLPLKEKRPDSLMSQVLSYSFYKHFDFILCKCNSDVITLILKFYCILPVIAASSCPALPDHERLVPQSASP